MIGEDKAAIVAAPTPIAAHAHPSRTKSSGVLTEATYPRGAHGAGWRDDERAAIVARPLGGCCQRRQHRDPRFAIQIRKSTDRAVHVNGLLCKRGEFGKHALRFAERIAEEDG